MIEESADQLVLGDIYGAVDRGERAPHIEVWYGMAEVSTQVTLYLQLQVTLLLQQLTSLKKHVKNINLESELYKISENSKKILIIICHERIDFMILVKLS